MGNTHSDLYPANKLAPRLFHSKLSADKFALHWKMGRRVGKTVIPVESRNGVILEAVPVKVIYEIPE